MCRDQAVQRPVARQVDALTEILLEHPLHVVDGARPRARGAFHSCSAQLTQGGRDARVDRRLASVLSALVDEPEDALGAVALVLATHGLRRHLDERCHGIANVLEQWLELGAGVDRDLHRLQLFDPGIQHASLRLRQRGNQLNVGRFARERSHIVPDDVGGAQQFLDDDLADELLLQRSQHGVPIVDRDNDELVTVPGEVCSDPRAHRYAATAAVLSESGSSTSTRSRRHQSAE